MALITSIEQFSEFLPVNSVFEYGKILPSLKDVQRDLFEHYCGRKLIRDLDKKVMATPSALTSAETALLEHIRPALATITMTRFIPIGEVQFDVRGISALGDTDNRKAASDSQIVRLRASILSMGMNAFERLLGFLEEQVSDYPDHSQVLAARQRTILPNAVEFSKCYQIFDSHLTYRGLLPLINQIEEDRLAPFLGAHYDVILLNQSLSLPYSALRRKAQRALAYSAVSEAIALNMAVELNAEGLRLNYTGQFGNVKFYQPPTDKLRDSLLSAALKKATALMEEVGNAVAVLEGDANTGFGLVDNKDSKIIMM